MKVKLFMQTLLEGLTKNEGVELSDKDIEKEVEKVRENQTRNLKELAIDVENRNTIPLNEEKGFRKPIHVDEKEAGKKAKEVKEVKEAKEQQRDDQSEIGK